MKLAISNIAWNESEDEVVYSMLKNYGINGLEVAPTRLIATEPYQNKERAAYIISQLHQQYGFVIPSMQSILFGRNERLFGSAKERGALTDYLCHAVDFASAIGCGNLVFGAPRNRNYQPGEDLMVVEDFFREIAEYALKKGTVLSMEANPTIYGTNYINATHEAVDLVKRINHPGFMINFDLGTVIQNQEDILSLREAVVVVNHVHISEPYLAPVIPRLIHKQTMDLLRESGYTGYVSIEMKRDENDAIGNVERAIDYVMNL